MDVALSAVKWQFQFFSLKDIVAFSRVAAERINYDKLVLTLLREAGAH